MKIPTEMFLAAIEEQKVYFFSTTKINTPDPHFFICIKRTDDDLLIMSCCTSQFEKLKNFVESRSLPLSTLVWISSADTSNPFTKDTYVNCNSVQTFTVDEFKTKYEADAVTFSGEISDMHYVQILTGLHDSPRIEEDVKEVIPHPDSI